MAAYDVAVIGGGPAGYVAGVRVAQSGEAAWSSSAASWAAPA